MSTFLLALAILLGAAPAHASGPPTGILLPLDEAALDPSFERFRDDLRAAVERRDSAAVVAAAAPGIRLSFGGDGGRETLRSWLADPATGDSYWRSLGRALGYGAVRLAPDGFCAPYYACSDFGLYADPFQTVIVTAADVPAHAAPDADSPVIARLGYDVLPFAEFVEGGRWVGVVLPDGGVGYVARPGFGLPLDYRAYFGRTEAGWELQSFVSGD